MNRLAEIRKSKKLNQKDIAKLIKVKQNTISNWENEKTEIDNHSLNILADYFNVSTDYLLGRTDNPNSPTPERIDSLSPNPIENEILEEFRLLCKEKNEQQQKAVVAFIRTLREIE